MTPPAQPQNQQPQERPTRPARKEVQKELRKWLRAHYGVIGRREAVRLGASSQLIVEKLNSGEWAAMHRGVYRDTAVPHGPYQDTRAAFVATHGTGVLSHASAGWLWGILAQAPGQPEISVPAAGTGGRRLKGVTFHRYADLDVTKASEWKTFRVTNPLRTIVDLAGSVRPEALTDAIDAALAKRLITVEGIVAELERIGHRGRPGAGRLRDNLLDRGFIGAPAPSVLEAKARRLVIATGLPLPRVELQTGDAGEYRLDIAWPPILLSVEVDGYVWHFSPDHLQRDSARRNHLQQAGWTVLVYTWRDVCHEPARVAREITITYQRLLNADK